MKMRKLGRHDIIEEHKKTKRAEHYQRRSKAMKQNNPGFKGETSWNKGIPRTEEDKQKISATARKRNQRKAGS